MKTYLLKVALVSLLFSSTITVSAQITKEQLQERKELQKMAKNELKQKASRSPDSSRASSARPNRKSRT